MIDATEPTFDVFVFGTRTAATAAMTCAMFGKGIDARREHFAAAFAGTMPAKRVAGRINGAAKRAGLPMASPTALARRIPELLKGKGYATMPYGDGDRTIVVVRHDVAISAQPRTLKATAAQRMASAAPALKAAREMRPRLIAA